MSTNKDINIAVVGNTGDGKSTLINAVLSLDISETGVGKPITQDIFAYRVPRSKLCLFDTKGFEIEQSQKTVNDVVQFVKNRQNDEIEKQIHCVWLCTNSQGERWQDVHESILKVVNNLSIPCIVVITQCYGDHEKYVEYVEHNVPAGVSVIPVLAKALELPGTKVEAWGIDDLTSTTERVGLKYISQVKKSKVLAKSASIAKKTIGGTFVALGLLVALTIGILGLQDCGDTPGFGTRITQAGRARWNRYEACNEQNGTTSGILAVVLAGSGFAAWYTFMKK